MASRLRDKMVTPSVSFRTPNEAGHIDLDGKAHFDKKSQKLLDTPHVQVRELKVEKNGEQNFPRKSEITKPATKQDIRIAKKKRLFKDDDDNEDK